MLRVRVPRIAVVGGGGITGNASVTFPTFTCSGNGSLAIQGNGAATFPAFTATATSTLAIQGNASVTFPAVTGSGTGTLAIQGNASVTFPAFTCSGTGVLISGIVGNASVTFPAITGSGTGSLAIQGLGNVTFPAITSDPLVYPVVGTDSATKRFDVDGNYVSRFGTSSKFTITGSSTGNNGTYTVASVSYLGGSDKTRIVVQETVPANGGGGTLTQINGALFIQGNASVTFPTFTCSGTGVSGNAITGDASVVFPSITGSGTGSLLIQGNASVTFPNITLTSGEIPTVSVGGGTSISKKAKKRIAKNSEVLRWSKEKDTFKPDALEKVLLNRFQTADQIIEETFEVQNPKIRKASQKRIDALNAEKAQKAFDLKNQKQIAKEERLLLESIAKEDAEIIDMYLKMEQKETMALLNAMRVIL